MTTRALVTGGNGFVAQWAIRAMLERGWEPAAAGVGARPSAHILTEREIERVRWCPLDITDQSQVAAVMADTRPDVVLHLAGISFIPEAAHNPAHAFEVNALGVVRLLSEVTRLRDAGSADPAVLVVGSAEEYGAHPAADLPLDEGAVLLPMTKYAASKVAQEIAALQVARAEGIRVMCTRSFNHSGPGQAEHFLIPGLVRKTLASRANGRPLPMGNVDSVRDFLHVSDVASAYLSLLEKGTSGEVYNVASGEGVSVRELAESVMERLGVRAGLSIDPASARAVDVPVLVGNNMKLRSATGWTPRKTRLDIIDDLIHAATR